MVFFYIFKNKTAGSSNAPALAVAAQRAPVKGKSLSRLPSLSFYTLIASKLMAASSPRSMYKVK
jgi:hypothetical protein